MRVQGVVPTRVGEEEAEVEVVRMRESVDDIDGCGPDGRGVGIQW